MLSSRATGPHGGRGQHHQDPDRPHTHSQTLGRPAGNCQDQVRHRGETRPDNSHNHHTLGAQDDQDEDVVISLSSGDPQKYKNVIRWSNFLSEFVRVKIRWIYRKEKVSPCPRHYEDHLHPPPGPAQHLHTPGLSWGGGSEGEGETNPEEGRKETVHYGGNISGGGGHGERNTEEEGETLQSWTMRRTSHFYIRGRTRRVLVESNQRGRRKKIKVVQCLILTGRWGNLSIISSNRRERHRLWTDTQR